MNTPIYEQAMGRRLRPVVAQLQDYFSLAPGSGRYGVGEASSTSWAAVNDGCAPLLRLTSGEQAFFPEYGERVPFRIENHAHLDPFGRSSLTARQADIPSRPRTRIFQDTTSVRSPRPPPGAGGQPQLVDYVGRYRRLVDRSEP